ncbi:hypothetical protein IQ273_28465 [Nodosilinea sp. LEGE 07298]|uniref:hypothetical protein n=1 Tax=Nodosilinea sp. LEGE 07298 TaxID=2777970 RepID=UPI00188300F4|nr:hypothetical protein [Nodosilinea sp. LEGE 07298]MBE9113315.1 hypothetical protein [Nodosilinea sp. LEGE 07298]
MIQWRNIEVFRGIDLNDSCVLSWKLEPTQLVFELDVSVWPESQFYTTPKPNEYTCYRTARLIFRGCEKITGLHAMGDVRPTVDPDNTIDYDNIDALNQEEAVIRVYGNFGEVEIQGGSFDLEFDAV